MRLIQPIRVRSTRYEGVRTAALIYLVKIILEPLPSGRKSHWARAREPAIPISLGGLDFVAQVIRQQAVDRVIPRCASKAISQSETALAAAMNLIPPRSSRARFERVTTGTNPGQARGHGPVTCSNLRRFASRASLGAGPAHSRVAVRRYKSAGGGRSAAADLPSFPAIGSPIQRFAKQQKAR